MEIWGQLSKYCFNGKIQAEEARVELVELSSFLWCFIAITKLYIMDP